jgi:hypothetical protein
MVKNLTRMIDIETEMEWRVDKRTRGHDRIVPGSKPMATWVLILSNREGERRFIAEDRITEFFRLPETKN